LNCINIGIIRFILKYFVDVGSIERTYISRYVTVKTNSLIDNTSILTQIYLIRSPT
jgi:hypothetical protein